MTAFLDLFSGIGGFALAAYWAGLRFDKHYFSEIEPYAVELYKKRFPEAEPLGDKKNVDYSKLPRGEWLVTCGFPCQPHSVAGKRKASEDERDLWPECARMLRELRPRIALFENVRGLLTSPGRDRKGEFFNGVLSDVHGCGYAAEWQIISAADVGAPHLRKRVWIVAYADSFRLEHGGKGQGEAGKQDVQAQSERICTDVADTEGVHAQRQLDGQGQGELGRSGWWKIEPPVGVLVDGLPAGLGGYEGRICAKSFERVNQLKCYGNSIVPQCAEMIFNLPAFDYWRIAARKTK